MSSAHHPYTENKSIMSSAPASPMWPLCRNFATDLPYKFLIFMCAACRAHLVLCSNTCLKFQVLIGGECEDYLAVVFCSLIETQCPSVK